jgi:hypothetical protein
VGEYCFNPGEEMQHDTSLPWLKRSCMSAMTRKQLRSFMETNV